MDESVSNHASISTLSTYDQSSRIITILSKKSVPIDTATRVYLLRITLLTLSVIIILSSKHFLSIQNTIPKLPYSYPLALPLIPLFSLHYPCLYSGPS